MGTDAASPTPLIAAARAYLTGAWRLVRMPITPPLPLSRHTKLCRPEVPRGWPQPILGHVSPQRLGGSAALTKPLGVWP